jgi:glycosyltransferase involved in cell wall biosynthesis
MPAGLRTVTVVAPVASLGPRRAAAFLAQSLAANGWTTSLAERPGRGDHMNVHLSNSSRSLLPYLLRTRDRLVTLHDVRPRDVRLRPFLEPVLARCLSRHEVVVHSEHAARLVRELGWNSRPSVVPLELPVETLTTHEVSDTRERLRGARGGRLLAMAGVIKPEKGVQEVLQSAGAQPDVTFVLAGRAFDDSSAALLQELPANVVHVDDPDDHTFCLVIAACDALLLPRSTSVGETSGPLVMAHALGTPVAMFDAGSAAEYADRHDLVVPASDGVPRLVERASEREWIRIATDPEGRGRRLTHAYTASFQQLGWTR